MTQLDIPQISFARYLELLRRRRWQVIPITILGLVIGTAVAFMIPRYYVAYTQFSFEGEIIEAKSLGSAQDDPMRAIVENAKILIPSTVRQVLDELAWPEAKDEDIDRRRAFIEATKDRVTVEDPQGGWRGQEMVSLQISYRDTDGSRAAEFANKLRETFISSQRARLEKKAQRSLDAILSEVEDATLALENIAMDLRTYRSVHGIDPQLDLISEVLQSRGLQGELRDQQGVLDERKIALTTAQGSLATKQLQITDLTIKPRREVTIQDPAMLALRQRQIALIAQLGLHKLKLNNLKPAHPDYFLLKKQIDDIEATLALDPSLGRPTRRSEPNPLFEQVKLEIAEGKNRVNSLTEAVARQQGAVDALDQRIADLPEIWGQYQEFQNRYQEAITAKANKVEQEEDLLEQFNRLKNEDSFLILSLAHVPPAPTEPSIVVVSILGAVIGLALAIALILVIDIMQTTFKTVEDVERGLAIPVLGNMAHLQTSEERLRVRFQRRRLALVAIVFLSLTVAVVTIYHVAPTRLPAGVYQVLDMLLGSPG